jgi:glycerol-3-phosphate dehydrogenase
MLLAGTTDTPFDGDPRDVRPSGAEEREILHEVGLAVDLSTDGVRARFAGVRVLPAGAADTPPTPMSPPTRSGAGTPSSRRRWPTASPARTGRSPRRS